MTRIPLSDESDPFDDPESDLELADLDDLVPEPPSPRDPVTRGP